MIVSVFAAYERQQETLTEARYWFQSRDAHPDLYQQAHDGNRHAVESLKAHSMATELFHFYERETS